MEQGTRPYFPFSILCLLASCCLSRLGLFGIIASHGDRGGHLRAMGLGHSPQAAPLNEYWG